jgi:hypothetical protein
MGNGWNLRQPAWPKPNGVKSLQSWASRTRRASMHAQGREYEVSEGSIRKVWDNRENSTYNNEFHPIQTHLLNLKVLPTSKALKLYMALSLTSTTNCFASMLKQKLEKCMMNCNDRLRRFNETLTNRHSMPSIKNSCTCDKWLCMTCSIRKVWTLIFVKKIRHWNGRLP